MAATATEKEMLTSGKIAEKLGVSPAKIKKAITDLALEPDAKKGPCAYYGSEKAEQIKKALGV
jgi:predicted transcriptional regulator